MPLARKEQQVKHRAKKRSHSETFSDKAQPSSSAEMRSSPDQARMRRKQKAHRDVQIWRHMPACDCSEHLHTAVSDRRVHRLKDESVPTRAR